MSIEEYEYPKPVAPFEYALKTTSVMEHSRGIAWTANLLHGEKVIGIVEQMGDGGADRVYITDVQDRVRWAEDVAAAFADDGEEGATFYLLCQEEEV